MPRGRRQRVLFARVNRRAEPSLVQRDFREVMLSLTAARNLRCTYGGHEWIAGDLEVTPDDLLVGVLGYSTVETAYNFDEDSWSWLKGTQTTVEGGGKHTLAPFAIDLNRSRRWIAFAPTGYINDRSFDHGLQAVLQEALRRQEEVFSDWEVNMYASSEKLRDFLLANGTDIESLTLILRMPNPGRYLDDDRAAMERLKAGTLNQRFTPRRNQTLDVSRVVDELAEEISGTDADIHIRTRTGPRFNSNEQPTSVFIEPFGSELRLGIELVSDALRQFVGTHSTPTQTGDPDDET